MRNNNLNIAKRIKNDEFYTRLEDIEMELKFYSRHFANKIVLCNCDNPYESNFYRYFVQHFNQLGLKKLITTCYSGSNTCAYKLQIQEVRINKDGSNDITDIHELIKNDKNTLSILNGDGSFDSPECIELLQEADIVVTNPPFSLLRKYVAMLMKSQKLFLIIASQNLITYKEVFPYIRTNQMWIGYNKVHSFVQPPSNSLKIFGNICWFTNMDIQKRHEDLVLINKYNPEDYPKYDNYDAISVKATNRIPMDYMEIMGVPITFLEKYNPDQFEIVGNEYELNIPSGRTYLNGKRQYSRIFIRRI